MITLGGIKFFDAQLNEIHHDDPNLPHLAMYVWILFVNQKNGERNESRTHRRSNDPQLCPVIRFARVVRRVRKFFPNFSESTPLCSIDSHRHTSKFISKDFTRTLMKNVCRKFGGSKTFGFDPDQIGNRSIRSGAAMALFLKGHSADRIMILGRWKSKAFLRYIRPEILSWTDLFSSDMISFDNFYELCSEQSRSTRNGNKQKPETMDHLEFPNLMVGIDY